MDQFHLCSQSITSLRHDGATTVASGKGYCLGVTQLQSSRRLISTRPIDYRISDPAHPVITSVSPKSTMGTPSALTVA